MLLNDEEIGDLFLEDFTLEEQVAAENGAKAQLKKVVEEFGNGWCSHRMVNDPYANPPNPPLYHKWECTLCWQSLLQEVK